jgi:(p)ppGpp synthase/HD superfamily hydrolase
MADIVIAADYAATKHTNQRRKNAARTPYINHPLGVGMVVVVVVVT